MEEYEYEYKECEYKNVEKLLVLPVPFEDIKEIMEANSVNVNSVVKSLSTHSELKFFIFFYFLQYWGICCNAGIWGELTAAIGSPFPEEVAVRAKITVIVLGATVEIATVNTIPNVICWRIQPADFGCPVNSKNQRQQQMREMSMM
jgi:hypothetical protein